MEKITSGPVPYFQFKIFQNQPITHAVFTRHGGFSEAPYDSLNVRYTIGDSDYSVTKNRQQIAETLNTSPEKLVSANQTHSANIHFAGSSLESKTSKPNEVPDTDAFITTQPNLHLLIQTADCQPVLIYDPTHHIVAAIHSGWRGSLQDIIGLTVRRLVKDFSSKPQDLLVGIGPSLGPCCAEFKNYQQEFPQSFIDAHSAHINSDSHIDFWQISVSQLLSTGVLPQNIETSEICTLCNSKDFFSYRAANRAKPPHSTGRFATTITLNS